jgi:hypothetical protein
MKMCFHPHAVSDLRTPAPQTRYERKITGPGKGMIRRVRLVPQPYWDVSCPDCPAHAYWVHPDGMTLWPSMPPWLFADTLMEPGLERVS